MNTSDEKYLIRYTSGKKTNEIEEFDFTKTELSIGRNTNSDIRFDPETDLAVSREHGKIIKKTDDLFVLEDNNSRNGTFINGKKINGTVLLNPGDEIKLGSNGPSFVFDLLSRSETGLMPTQLVSVSPVTTTIELNQSKAKTSPKSSSLKYWLALPIVLLLAGAGVLWQGNQNNVVAKMDGEGELDVQIFPMQAMMPAAYKVYANPLALDGRYFFAKIVLDNKGKGALKDVKVEYAIPGFINWTKTNDVQYILPSGSYVATIYPQFPQSITQKTTESTERMQIRISYTSNNKQEKYEKTYLFQMLSRNDFLYTNIPASEVATVKDKEDNNDLAPVFVTPQDPIVKYYVQQVQEKVLGGETASVENKTEEAVRFMMGVYEATRRTHMVYSGTGGAFVQQGDIQSVQQKIRLPREVITGNTGLCIEMAFLYASAFAAEGLKPVIFFVPGHAYPGINYNGQLLAIEPTAVGGEGLGHIASPVEAFQIGMKNVQEFLKFAQQGDPRYTMIDVNALISQGVQQMELTDDAFLRTKVDELAKKFAIGGPFVFAKTNQTFQNGQQAQ
ncbi:MAG: FHA domain-containing protein [Chitinophagaceae bacterium]|nr:MAG: FHA domain-containing protein [Chitinophagaceae bacterium]